VSWPAVRYGWSFGGFDGSGARVWSVWARKHGLDPETVVKIAHGRPSISTIRELLPRADHEAEDREVERLEIEDVEGIAALPGAAELFRRAAGKPVRHCNFSDAAPGRSPLTRRPGSPSGKSCDGARRGNAGSRIPTPI